MRRFPVSTACRNVSRGLPHVAALSHGGGFVMPLHTLLTKPMFSAVNRCEVQLTHLVTRPGISTDNRSTQTAVPV